MFPLGIATLTCTLHKEVVTINGDAAAVGNNCNTIFTNNRYVSTIDGYVAFVRTNAGTTAYIQVYATQGNIFLGIYCVFAVATFNS